MEDNSNQVEEPFDQTEDQEPEINQPGIGKLREAVANYTDKRIPERGKLRQDALAGMNSALTSVPDGLASGLLVGVNPIYGLYATMTGPIVGGIFSSSRLMVITTTSAASLAAGQALVNVPDAERAGALFIMVILIGIIQILFGVLRLGRLTRYVSYSVMTGLITGIAVLTVLSQLPTVAGYEASGDSKIAQTIDLLTHLHLVDLPTIVLSLFTFVLIIFLPRTKLGNFGWLVAIIIPSLITVLFNMNSIEVVRDMGEIPRGLPAIFVPSMSNITFDVVTGALAVAVIILVQGAGVSQSVPNPDGSRSSSSQDFTAQGAANVVSGVFRGLPVGGSLSSTAVNVISGALSNWAAIFSGLWAAALVIFIPGLVGYVAMLALGVLLIVASSSTIKPSDIMSIWNTGWPSMLACATTFICTLILPIQVAVGIGVVLSALLYVNESSTDISVVELEKQPDGKIVEKRPSKELAGNKVTVFDIYGNLFYAGARTLERLLPTPEKGTKHPVVILRLRGRTGLGATMIEVLSNYADTLSEVNGRLYLSGISEKAYKQISKTKKLNLDGPVRAYEVTPIVGQSTHKAHEDAQAWLVSKNDGDE